MEKAHIGTMGWSYNFWRGNLYPKGCRPAEFLSEYSKHFNTVEIDSTFYRIPYKSTIAKWRDLTPLGFIFSAKFPRVITHEKMLKDCDQELERFLDAISLLQSKTGPLILQFPPGFKYENIHVLSDFLKSLPKKYRFVVEVRNKKILTDKLYSILRDNEVSLAIVDSPFLPITEEVTADFIYLRWEGDRRKVKGNLGRIEVNRTNDIKKWADKMKTFIEKSTEVFGYFSKYYSGYPPNDAEQLLGYL